MVRVTLKVTFLKTENNFIPVAAHNVNNFDSHLKLEKLKKIFKNNCF